MVDLSVPHALVIEVPAEDDAFVLQRCIAPFEQPDHVVGRRAARARVHHAHLDHRIAQRDRSRFERAVDGRLQLGGWLSCVREQRGSDVVVDGEVGDGDAVVVEQRL